MDLELQSVLLIVGIIAIIAILLHGLLTIRRSNKPIDVSELNLNEIDDQQERDTSGFDCHGVGVARVIKKNNPADLVTTPESQFSINSENEESSVQVAAIDFDVALDSSKSDIEPTINQGIEAEINKDIDNKTVPLFTSPIAKEKEGFLSVKSEEIAKPETIKNVEVQTVKEPKVKEVIENKPVEVKETNQEIMDVLVLNVVGEDGNDLDGATLLPVLLTLGFKFGDMNIFHRHVDAAGQGAVLFSLANMVQPGHFDIDNMEQFSTTGVSLFMTIPHKQGNMETFNTMLNASAKIAEEFNGQVLDGDRVTLTNQSTQKYVQRIRKLERN